MIWAFVSRLLLTNLGRWMPFSNMRLGMSAQATAMSANAPRIAKVTHVWRVERMRAMTMMGHSSPQVP